MDEHTVRDRNGLEIIDHQACLALLAERAVGRVSFVEAGSPTIVPVNHLVDGGAVVFRSVRGAKLDAAERHHPVAFEVDDLDPDTRTGWSVVVTGIAEPIDDPDVVRRLEARGLDSWAMPAGAASTWVRIRAEHVSGRRIVPTAP